MEMLSFALLIVVSFLSAIMGTMIGMAMLILLPVMIFLGIPVHTAVANQKAVTLPVSIIATLVFVYKGIIDYRLGIPLFIVNVMGGWIGATLILKFSGAWLKRIIVPISIVLAISLIFF